MFETNTNNSLISLARAAQLTGYHQDYLGQLCRLGRLPAKKVGRNWFTSSEALNNLTSISEPPQEVIEEPVIEMAPPAIAQSITVSQVEELPITITTIPRPVQNSNNVQTIITTLRIESLQKEVADLREMLSRLMAEVTRHSHLLEGRVPAEVARIQDSLRHRYSANFDFNISDSQPTAFTEPDSIAPPQIWTEPTPKYTSNYIVTWITATAALVAIAFIVTGMLVGSFWGPSPETQIKTVYHHSQVLTPTVAGATDEPTNTPLPTENLGQQGPNVIQ